MIDKALFARYGYKEFANVVLYLSLQTDILTAGDYIFVKDSLGNAELMRRMRR